MSANSEASDVLTFRASCQTWVRRGQVEGGGESGQLVYEWEGCARDVSYRVVDDILQREHPEHLKGKVRN